MKVVTILLFKTFVSFTTDLKVAKRFSNQDGIIIGLNMQRSIYWKMDLFTACDVSWISDFENEMEILVSQHSTLQLYQSKMTEIGKLQYFVCDEGTPAETSFQNMFMK